MGYPRNTQCVSWNLWTILSSVWHLTLLRSVAQGAWIVPCPAPPQSVADSPATHLQPSGCHSATGLMFYKLSFLKAQSIRQVTCNFTAIDCFDDVVPLFVSAALAVCVYKLSFTTGRHTHRSKRTDTGFCRFHTYGLGARDIPLEKRGPAVLQLTSSSISTLW